MPSSEPEPTPEDEQEEDDQAWEDWEAQSGDEAEGEPVQSLFCSARLPSAKAALDYDAANFGLDFRLYRQHAKLGVLETIRCINYLRFEVMRDRNPLSALVAAVASDDRPWADNMYLTPTLPDDGLLFYNWEVSYGWEEEDETSLQEGKDKHRVGDGKAGPRQSMEALEEENAALRAALQSFREASSLEDLPGPRSEGIEDRVQDEVCSRGGERAAGWATALRRAGAASSTLPNPRTERERIDQKYYASYGYLGIHQEMLADQVRTLAYRHALEGNPARLRGARVLDLGCGTGILSLFSARAGADTVIGVEGSPEMAELARRAVSTNAERLQECGAEGQISVISARIEDLEELPCGKVDVIVSEWMGYALLFESMLDSVLHARDRFLADGGIVLPDKASVHVAAGGPDTGGLGFWRDVHGFSMMPLHEVAVAEGYARAVVVPVVPTDIVTSSQCVHGLDLLTMHAADADFTTDFRLLVKPAMCDGAANGADCHALVMWFDADFSDRVCKESPVTLTTSPHAPPTHWAQTVLTLRTPVYLHGDEALEGRISMARSHKHRSIDISLEYWRSSDATIPAHHQQQLYELAMSS